jgi:hypothetical protein
MDMERENMQLYKFKTLFPHIVFVGIVLQFRDVTVVKSPYKQSSVL